MGGLAFANVTTPDGKPPYIPRMPAELYHTITAECQKRLETLLLRVVVPRDAPAKADYGDVDFLVGGIKADFSDTDIWTTIKEVLGAKLHLPRGGSHSYAVSHPSIPDAYVQVDVELSPGDGTPDAADLFAWTQFMKGDSDLMQILGICHRSLGLTCNDQGLHVRVPEVEPYNKKKSLLFLTREPNEVMEFYGLDSDKYWEGFRDETDLFDWVSSGQFFSAGVFEKRVEKSNDRSRQAKRPMYRRYVEEYMPRHADKGSEDVWTREQVLEFSLQFFGDDVQVAYCEMLEEHRVKEAEEELWADIAAAIPTSSRSSLALVLKSLRRWVGFDKGRLQMLPEAKLDEYEPWVKVMSTGSKDQVLAFVKEHWEEAKVLEKARANAAREAATKT